jgi:hypothetical protein
VLVGAVYAGIRADIRAQRNASGASKLECAMRIAGLSKQEEETPCRTTSGASAARDSKGRFKRKKR